MVIIRKGKKGYAISLTLSTTCLYQIISIDTFNTSCLCTNVINVVYNEAQLFLFNGVNNVLELKAITSFMR